MRDGQWEPVSRGDDSGLYYLVPELSRITGWSVDKSLDVFLLGIPVLSGLIGLFGLWAIYRGLLQRLLAIVPVGVWSLPCLPYDRRCLCHAGLHGTHAHPMAGLRSSGERAKNDAFATAVFSRNHAGLCSMGEDTIRLSGSAVFLCSALI